MQKIVIRGGCKLDGEVEVSGAKNAALPLLIASILARGEHEIGNVPDLVDVATTCKLLEGLGAEVERSRSRVRISTRALSRHEAPYDLVKTMRASVLCLGPLVARYGRARVSLPGGCAIGARPVDQHLMGLEKLGARVSLAHGYVEARARQLRGATIVFDLPTVTGTENLLMASVLAKGETVLENAAREPEVLQLAEALCAMGARIEGAGTKTLRIQGVDELGPLDCSVIPDRIEAGTLMIAAAIGKGRVCIRGAVLGHLTALVGKLREAGVEIAERDGGVWVRSPQRLRAVDVATQPHPGFPTDMQAQFMALMCLADGTSVIAERIFENRFMHALGLRRMGAQIKQDGGRAIVRGVDKLSGAPVMATDLRASASLVLAGLVAEGTTEVHRVYHLDRGYQRLDAKLRSLGADIHRSRARPPVTVR
ncbi:MAG: UDP-N-acetylglucosamine 1-carboxyvinyltransferase [Deltaproteobacteria bacterium]|nr:UDP-N-acetylglucosamine 1-carboxyvinyltransferase [Deltaproteobacteria bacterium]